MLAQINRLYMSMTDAEKKIADIIIGNPIGIARMQSRELAKLAGTAPSAVTRFCQTIGVGSFGNLKIRLAEEGAKLSLPENITKFSETDSASEIFTKVFNSGMRTLQDTLSNIDFDTIEAIAEQLINANKIFCFGVATAGIVASNANNRFTQMGLNSTYSNDLMFMNIFAANLNPGDVALAMSHTGNTKAVVDAARLAKKSGATLISITSFSQNLLAKESDYKIIVHSDNQNYPFMSISSYFAIFQITDALMIMLTSKARDTVINQMKKNDEIFRPFYYKQ